MPCSTTPILATNLLMDTGIACPIHRTMIAPGATCPDCVKDAVDNRPDGTTEAETLRQIVNYCIDPFI